MISNLDPSPRPDVSVYPLPPHLTLGLTGPLEDCDPAAPHAQGGNPAFPCCWPQTPAVTEQEPMGPSQDRPHPISSAVAPLWSMEITVSDAYSVSCFTDAETPDEWKKLTTWWAWTRNPQVSSAWGFVRLATCCYLTNQRTLHQWITHSVTPSFTWPVQLLCWNPSGSSGFRAQATRPLCIGTFIIITSLSFTTTWHQ